MDSQNGKTQLVYICSEHPLALQIMKETITSDPGLSCKAMKCSRTAALTELQPFDVLVLDCCSNDNWPDTAIRWKRRGGATICLVSSDSIHYHEQLRALYLGVSGIVTVSHDMPTELLAAVHAVLQGKLWYSRSILAEYVKQRRIVMGEGTTSSLRSFTVREEQIVSFVMRKFGNKQIADALGISERTVKYHVSNILRKAEVSNRKELLEVMGDLPSTKKSAAVSREELEAS